MTTDNLLLPKIGLVISDNLDYNTHLDFLERCVYANKTHGVDFTNPSWVTDLHRLLEENKILSILDFVLIDLDNDKANCARVEQLSTNVFETIHRILYSKFVKIIVTTRNYDSNSVLTKCYNELSSFSSGNVKIAYCLNIKNLGFEKAFKYCLESTSHSTMLIQKGE